MNKLCIDFLSWLNVHRAGRELLFNQMREKYDWGYIKACEVIEAEFKRIIEEHKDESDRIAGDKGLLGEEIHTSCHLTEVRTFHHVSVFQRLSTRLDGSSTI